MRKSILLIFLSFMFTGGVYAQSGRIVYYFKNSGKLVASRDSADYSMVVSSPDTSVDKTLYIVYEYDKQGKIILATGSKTNDINLRYEGAYITYFKNGHKMKVGRLNNGVSVGTETEYYPNGKLFHLKNYIDGSGSNKVYLKECRDSIGNLLAENGTGKWIEYDDKFENIEEEGAVLNGNKDSLWTTYNGKILVNRHMYHKGDLLPSLNVDELGHKLPEPEVMPEFPGGIEAFKTFISSNMRYPAVARENGTQGKLLVDFVVESDGTITDVRVRRGIGDGCDEESMRVVMLMPKWKPGIRNGKTARVAFTVPMVFGLTENHK